MKLNFDGWVSEITEQMARKGHGFDPGQHQQSAALWALVASEVVEAGQEWKRNHFQHPAVLAGELADALIRIGHFAGTVGVRFDGDRRFVGVLDFNELGDQHRDGDAYPIHDFWRGLNAIMSLCRSIGNVHSYWENVAFYEEIGSSEREYFGAGVRQCVLEICILARRMNLNIDAAVQARTAYNETRPVGYNIAIGKDA